MRTGDRVLVANTSDDLRADEVLPDGTPAVEAAINALAGRNDLGLAPGNFVNTQTFRGELKLSSRTELGAMEAVRTGLSWGGDYEIEHQRRDRVRQTTRALVAQMVRRLRPRVARLSSCSARASFRTMDQNCERSRPRRERRTSLFTSSTSVA